MLLRIKIRVVSVDYAAEIQGQSAVKEGKKGAINMLIVIKKRQVLHAERFRTFDRHRNA